MMLPRSGQRRRTRGGLRFWKESKVARGLKSSWPADWQPMTAGRPPSRHYINRCMYSITNCCDGEGATGAFDLYGVFTSCSRIQRPSLWQTIRTTPQLNPIHHSVFPTVGKMGCNQSSRLRSTLGNCTRPQGHRRLYQLRMISPTQLSAAAQSPRIDIPFQQTA